MGRKQLIIKRLEDMNARQVKYSKRKAGLLNKAKDITVLCDVDLAIIMFSPSGNPSLFVGHHKELLSVVDRLSKISVKDREKRRSAYTMKLLEKIYGKTDVDLKNFSLNNCICWRRNYLKLQQTHLEELDKKIAEKKKILNEWKNPEIISDLNKVEIMENHLIASLENIKARKIELIIEEFEQEEQDVQASEEIEDIEDLLY